MFSKLYFKINENRNDKLKSLEKVNILTISSHNILMSVLA